MRRKVFVSGIGTEVGKTIASSVLVEALQADYWKPVQSGDLHNTDSHKIARLSANHGHIYKETYALKIPASPHYSAREEDVQIELDNFQLPDTSNYLIVEGAGGLMVPLNDSETIMDLMVKLNLPVVLVSSAYLGSINHTLMTLEKVLARGLQLCALIFSGERNTESEDIIVKHFPQAEGKVLIVDKMDEVDQESISEAAALIKQPLIKLLDELD